MEQHSKNSIRNVHGEKFLSRLFVNKTVCTDWCHVQMSEGVHMWFSASVHSTALVSPEVLGAYSLTAT